MTLVANFDYTFSLLFPKAVPKYACLFHLRLASAPERGRSRARLTATPPCFRLPLSSFPSA